MNINICTMPCMAHDAITGTSKPAPRGRAGRCPRVLLCRRALVSPPRVVGTMPRVAAGRRLGWVAPGQRARPLVASGRNPSDDDEDEDDAQVAAGLRKNAAVEQPLHPRPRRRQRRLAEERARAHDMTLTLQDRLFPDDPVARRTTEKRPSSGKITCLG